MGSSFKNLITSIKDIFNAYNFRKEMKTLEIMEDEEFQNLKLKTNWLGNVVYTQIDFSDQALAEHDYSVHDMVMSAMQPYISYFEKIGWADYLIPQVSNLTDEDNGDMTLSYLYLFVFVPKVFSFWKLLKLILALTGLGGIIYGIVWYIGTYM
jgi:hypothetical protein